VCSDYGWEEQGEFWRLDFGHGSIYVDDGMGKMFKLWNLGNKKFI
jgi:hypothetical protein